MSQPVMRILPAAGCGASQKVGDPADIASSAGGGASGAMDEN